MPEAKAAYAAPQARVPRTLFQHAHEDGQAGFPVPLVGGQVAEVFILLPDNWNGTDKIIVWLLGGEASAIALDVTIDVGSCDEDYNTHTQTVNDIPDAIALDKYTCVDITASFATVIALMNARDMLWIKIDEDTGLGMWVVGVEIQET